MENFTHIFQKTITSNFINNLSKITCNTLAGMLILDYVYRTEKINTVNQYLSSCTSNLRNFLGTRILLDEKFSSTMTLFIVAISPTPINYDSSSDILITNRPKVINILISNFFKNLKPEEEENIRSLLAILLENKNLQEVIDDISNDPNFIKTISIQKINYKTINGNIKKQLAAIFQKNFKLAKNLNYIQNLTSNIITIISAVTLLSLSVSVSGPLIPLIILPTTIGVLKYIPKFGEKLGHKIFNIEKNIDVAKTELKDLKEKLISNLQVLTQEISNVENLQKRQEEKLSQPQLVEAKLTYKKVLQNIKPTQLKKPLPNSMRKNDSFSRKT